MEKNSRTHRYWRIVVERAWREAALGARVMFVILSALGATLVLGVQVFLDDWVFSAVTGVFYFILLLVWAIGGIPPKIHDELGGFEENPFRVDIFPPKHISETKDRWVSLRVHNDTHAKHLSDCFVLLDNIVDLQTKKETRREQKLLWSGREQNQNQAGNQPLPIAATDHAVCDVAKALPSEEMALYCQWFGNNKVREGSYFLNLVVFGNWKDLSYHPKYHVRLEYHGGNKISLSDIKDGWYAVKEQGKQ